jgi:hypothetical protein
VSRTAGTVGRPSRGFAARSSRGLPCSRLTPFTGRASPCRALARFARASRSPLARPAALALVAPPVSRLPLVTARTFGGARSAHASRSPLARPAASLRSAARLAASPLARPAASLRSAARLAHGGSWRDRD